MNLLEMATQALGGENLTALSQQVGADEQQTSSGIAAALPMILGALGKNASSSEGAQSLSDALDRDHDGSILNGLGDFVRSSDNGSGPGILKHAFGGQQENVQQGVSQLSGMQPAQAGSLLENLAPLVMGMLGQAKQQQGLDASGLANMLGQQQQYASSSGSGSTAMNLITSLLDQDKDGNVIDDVGNLISKFMK